MEHVGIMGMGRVAMGRSGSIYGSPSRSFSRMHYLYMQNGEKERESLDTNLCLFHSLIFYAVTHNEIEGNYPTHMLGVKELVLSICQQKNARSGDVDIVRC